MSERDYLIAKALRPSGAQLKRAFVVPNGPHGRGVQFKIGDKKVGPRFLDSDTEAGNAVRRKFGLVADPKGTWRRP